MKQFIYIFSVLFLALASCQQEEFIQKPVIESDGTHVTLQFNTDIPTFTTRGDSPISSMWVLAFDASGNYLEKAKANPLTSSTTAGSGSVRLPVETEVMHFIANMDLSGDSWNWTKGTNEKDIIPQMTSTTPVYWGRYKVVSSLSTDKITVSMLRNVAKITVKNETYEQFNGPTQTHYVFKLVGFAVAQGASKGTVAPFNENGDNTFTSNNNEVLTLPSSLTFADQSWADNIDPKYVFENNTTHPTFIVIKNTEGKYYKISLLKKSDGYTPWMIERNFDYEVTLKSFEGDPFKNGSESYEDALNAPAANNLYAEISRTSPAISDDNKNKLTVDKMVILATSAKTEDIQANYYPLGSGTASNSSIRATLLSDEGIIDGVGIGGSFNLLNGKFSVKIKANATGQKRAMIRVSTTDSHLVRVVEVIASKTYTFETYTKSYTYSDKDQAVNLKFYIPTTFPTDLYPVKCKIHATNLYPVGENKNMLIVYENNTYYYIYEATAPGDQTVKFMTSLFNSNEIVTIENEYFTTASMVIAKNFAPLNARLQYNQTGGTTYADIPSGTVITVTYNSTSAGAGSTAFTMGSDGKANPQTIGIPSDATNIVLSFETGYYKYVSAPLTLAYLNSSNTRNLAQTAIVRTVTFQNQNNGTYSNIVSNNFYMRYNGTGSGNNVTWYNYSSKTLTIPIGTDLSKTVRINGQRTTNSSTAAIKDFNSVTALLDEINNGNGIVKLN